MERISLRRFSPVARFLREPVIITYEYPPKDPRFGQVEELGVFTPTQPEVVKPPVKRT